MTLYEFNQLGYASLPSLTSSQLEEVKPTIVNFLTEHQSNYYLLLNNDIRYYTFYVYKHPHLRKAMADDLVDLVSELGEIKSIEISEDKEKIEFWVMYEGQCICLFFFDYARGVIEI